MCRESQLCTSLQLACMADGGRGTPGCTADASLCSICLSASGVEGSRLGQHPTDLLVVPAYPPTRLLIEIAQDTDLHDIRPHRHPCSYDRVRVSTKAAVAPSITHTVT